VRRNRAVVVDVRDVVSVLVPDLSGVDPGVVAVTNDADPCYTGKLIVVGYNDDFGVPVTIHIGDTGYSSTVPDGFGNSYRTAPSVRERP